MIEYIVVGSIAIVLVLLVSFVVQLRYGNGLMAKLFRIMMPPLAVVAFVAFILGKIGITLGTLVITLITGNVFVIMMIVLIQKTIIRHIQAQSDKVSQIVANLSMTSNDAAASAEEQAAAVTQVSSAVEVIHQMSKTTADNSQDVVNVAEKALEQGQDGLDSIRELAHILQSLTQTTDFVEVVNEVAEQSSLLAFNAGIEAAKAEEYGRGFSVVASEVRNLAERSKEAAKQIRESIRRTESGQDAIKSTDAIFSELREVWQDAAEKARTISGAALQQSAGIEQISGAMENLIQSGNHTALTSKQIRNSAHELTEVTNQLSLIIYGEKKETSSANGSSPGRYHVPQQPGF